MDFLFSKCFYIFEKKNTMKRFTIVGVRTIDEYVTYTVEAENEDDAIEMVESGEIDDNDDHWQRETSGGEDFTVQSVEDID